MPSGRGWAATGAAIGISVLWVLFGEPELLAVASFLLLGVATGVAFVRLTTPRVDVHRRITPDQVHEGDRAIVEVTITSPYPLRNVIVEDTVAELGAARFAAARIDAKAPLVARYEVLCRPRGAYDVGPATVLSSDMLGLAEAGGNAGVVDRLLVFPAYEELSGFPAVRGRDPSVQTTHPTFSPHGGEDFFTLREYQVGDDLRRVHWPSSAKRDELMIRQLEIPWQSQALVLMDSRRLPYTSQEAFEHAVVGAASVVRHLHRGGFAPFLWTGESDGRSDTHSGYLPAMTQLATIQPRDIDLERGIARLRTSGVGGGILLIVTGTPDESVLAGFRHLARSFTRTVVLAVTDGNDSMGLFERFGAATVVVGPDDKWAAAWQRATERTWSTATPG